MNLDELEAVVTEVAPAAVAAGKVKVTAADICAALRKRYCGQEATVVFEVAQGTGSRAHRHLDAIAMELWPSRGLALHGIEIKVSLYDFRNERRDPEKAEQLARFCDYFWIAAPVGVVPLEEMPSAWGLFEYEGGKLFIKKQPIKTDAQPVDRNFLAGMMRAASRGVSEIEKDAILNQRREELEDGFRKRVDERAKRMVGENAEDAENWRKLVTALKGKPDEYVYAPDVIDAIKFIVGSKFLKSWDGVRNLHERMVKAAKDIGDNLDALKIP